MDGDTAQAGPGIAAHLDWMQAACVMAVEECTATSIKVKRMHEDGYDICEMKLPAVFSVVKGINVPRVPALKAQMAAKNVKYRYGGLKTLVLI